MEQLQQNPRTRSPGVLVLDCSESMNAQSLTGETKIAKLNSCLRSIVAALKENPLARTRVQLAGICVGGAVGETPEVLIDWTDVVNYSTFDLNASGGAPLGSGLKLALKVIEDQKHLYRSHGINHFRPWVIILGAGEPTDDWDSACAAAISAESDGKCSILPIGVTGADIARLQQASLRSARVVPAIGEFDFVRSIILQDILHVISGSRPQHLRENEADDIMLPSTDVLGLHC